MQVVKKPAHEGSPVDYADRKFSKLYRSTGVSFASARIFIAVPSGLVSVEDGQEFFGNKGANTFPELIEVDGVLEVTPKK